MSAADDSLSDALGFVAQCRAALEHHDVASALLYLCSAERFTGLAVGMGAAYKVVLGHPPLARVDEVHDAINELREKLTRAFAAHAKAHGARS